MQVVALGAGLVSHVVHKTGGVVAGKRQHYLAAGLLVLFGKVVAQFLHGVVAHVDTAQVFVHQLVVLAVVGGGVYNIQRSIVHCVVTVALDGHQEAEPRLVLGHGFVQLFEVAVRG